MTSFGNRVDLRRLSITLTEFALPLTLDDLSGRSAGSTPPPLSLVTVAGATSTMVALNDMSPS